MEQFYHELQQENQNLIREFGQMKEKIKQQEEAAEEKVRGM